MDFQDCLWATANPGIVPVRKHSVEVITLALVRHERYFALSNALSNLNIPTIMTGIEITRRTRGKEEIEDMPSRGKLRQQEV